jgi:hypothetical protein
MQTLRSLAEIRADLSRAKTRLRQLEAEEYKHLVTMPCSLCKAPPGMPCVKGGTYHEGRAMGQKRSAHAERHRALEEAVVK